MTIQQQPTPTRHLKIRKSEGSYRPGKPMRATEALQRPNKRTLLLHFAIPTAGVEASDDELTAAGELRDQIRDKLANVSDCCRCQDRNQVGVKFQVSEGAENYDQLLSSTFLELREIVDGSALLKSPGAIWQATYESGALADEGHFITSTQPKP